MVREVCHVHASVHHRSSRRARGYRLHCRCLFLVACFRGPSACRHWPDCWIRCWLSALQVSFLKSIEWFELTSSRGGASSKLQFFLVISTCLLYLVAAGLFSRAVWYFQAQNWNNAVGSDAAELGAGAGSYDIDQSVWHINFGNPELNGGGGWGIFNAILGWTNSATYGSVISYNVYWIAVITGFFVMRYKETTGHLPFLKMKSKDDGGMLSENPSSEASRQPSLTKEPEKNVLVVQAAPARTISE